MNDFTTAHSQLALFLQEDPSNPLAPVAKQNFDILDRHLKAPAASSGPIQPVAAAPPVDTANTPRLKAQLAGASDTADDRCANCAATATVADVGPGAATIPGFDPGLGPPNEWTIRTVVDEVAVFFGVTTGGHPVNGLELSNIVLRDDNKPPDRVVQFLPQSKLPLRLGLLVDVSGSVQPRFAFEKHAAGKFLQQMLSNPSDLGFVAGFADSLNVKQELTADHDALSRAVEQLTTGGGTALFDSVSKACWMLAAYPEHERVARVLVVLSDGEENASHASLRQVIRDMEATGVTVYTISTKEGQSIITDADKVLQTLAERSGGESFFPGDLPTLGKSFDKLRDEIRSRYLIAYKPAAFEPNGKFRTISITAEKDGKNLKVHARKGYHARAETATP